MTEDEALIWYDFFQHRMLGWDIVMSIHPVTGRSDSRTRHTREAGELMRDIHFNAPSVDAFVGALRSGTDPAGLWPEAMQAVVRFRMAYKVPRELNEPTSAHFRKDQIDHGGEDWPEPILSHGKPATVVDHPPFPPRSARYLAWQSGAKV